MPLLFNIIENSLACTLPALKIVTIFLLKTNNREMFVVRSVLLGFGRRLDSGSGGQLSRRAYSITADTKVNVEVRQMTVNAGINAPPLSE